LGLKLDSWITGLTVGPTPTDTTSYLLSVKKEKKKKKRALQKRYGQTPIAQHTCTAGSVCVIMK
jgi:hypothetical protein